MNQGLDVRAMIEDFRFRRLDSYRRFRRLTPPISPPFHRRYCCLTVDYAAASPSISLSSFNAILPLSTPSSTVASQMSNMSYLNKFMKLLVRDCGRKVKAPKTPVGQPSSGSPWSLFAGQVRKMGTGSVALSLPFSCVLGLLSSMTSSAMVTHLHVYMIDGCFHHYLLVGRS